MNSPPNPGPPQDPISGASKERFDGIRRPYSANSGPEPCRHIRGKSSTIAMGDSTETARFQTSARRQAAE
jgi:hypothetical protein